ncbi:hypothetical protein GCM10022631_14280 [Deinococcus rubellus]|uniref:luciferase domain-containing protein n=1 Tax=Deinococcus rubellus TaxID=1889240 RepID=UPI0031E68DCA
MPDSDHTGPCEAALNTLGELVATLDGVQIRPYAYGQEGVFHHHTLIGHLHRSGVIGVTCPPEVRDMLIQRRQVRAHHDDPQSPWVVLTLDCAADLELAAQLLREAWLAQSPRPHHPVGVGPAATERPA